MRSKIISKILTEDLDMRKIGAKNFIEEQKQRRVEICQDKEGKESILMTSRLIRR